MNSKSQRSKPIVPYRRRYVAVCVDDKHIVTDIDTISGFKELDNGFMFKCGNHWYFSEYFFQHDNLERAWQFTHNVKAAVQAEWEETQAKEAIQRASRRCPDSL